MDDQHDPAARARTQQSPLSITPRSRDLGGFSVRRILPYMKRRMVGPFIFFDHMGPATFAPGEGMDVRPHPHIGLATVTYLFTGEIMHRDSLGYVQQIEAGAVNWMTAGRGIVHSERTPDLLREMGFDIEGIQSWIALPQEAEEVAPAFIHHPAETLPTVARPGVVLIVIAGTAFGETSPVKIFSPMFYVDAQLEEGASIDLPDYVERAVYPVEGSVQVTQTQDDTAPEEIDAGTMLVLKDGGGPARLTARKAARVMLLGGAAMDGPRHIWWNLVSSRPERIEQAKADWKAGSFAKVPGEDEFIPLPED